MGLEMPGLVVLGLYSSQKLARMWAEPWRTLGVLVGTTAGFIIGSVVLWWAALKLFHLKSAFPSTS